MAKTRKYTRHKTSRKHKKKHKIPKRKKMRKSKRKGKFTRKQKGGLCCRYEQKGLGCAPGFTYSNINSTEPTAGLDKYFRNGQYEPLWFNSNALKAQGMGSVHPISHAVFDIPYFMKFGGIQFGIMHHAMKHMEALGIPCYKHVDFAKLLVKMIPKLYWTSPTYDAATDKNDYHVYNPLTEKFSHFYNNIEKNGLKTCTKNRRHADTKGCIYYNLQQQQVDIATCRGFYIFEHPQKFGKSQSPPSNPREEEEKETKSGSSQTTKLHRSPLWLNDGERSKFNVKAIVLRFAKLINKNTKIKPPVPRLYRNTLFLLAIEIYDEQGFGNLCANLRSPGEPKDLQMVLLNNVSDCIKENKDTFVETQIAREPYSPTRIEKKWTLSLLDNNNDAMAKILQQLDAKIEIIKMTVDQLELTCLTEGLADRERDQWAYLADRQSKRTKQERRAEEKKEEKEEEKKEGVYQGKDEEGFGPALKGMEWANVELSRTDDTPCQKLVIVGKRIVKLYKEVMMSSTPNFLMKHPKEMYPVYQYIIEEMNKQRLIDTWNNGIRKLIQFEQQLVAQGGREQGFLNTDLKEAILDLWLKRHNCISNETERPLVSTFLKDLINRDAPLLPLQSFYNFDDQVFECVGM